VDKLGAFSPGLILSGRQWTSATMCAHMAQDTMLRATMCAHLVETAVGSELIE
jgi:hypothetical protein